jgi:hypothetical protein
MASKKVVIRVVLQQCIENRAVKNVLSLAQSGRKMTKELAEQIIQDVNNSAGHKQIIIIGLGGNDLRPKGVLAGHNVQQLVQLHKKIVAHVEATEGYGITFTLQSYVIFVVIHGRQIFFRGGGANSLKNPFLMDHFFSRWGGGFVEVEAQPVKWNFQVVPPDLGWPLFEPMGVEEGSPGFPLGHQAFVVRSGSTRRNGVEGLPPSTPPLQSGSTRLT